MEANEADLVTFFIHCILQTAFTVLSEEEQAFDPGSPSRADKMDRHANKVQAPGSKPALESATNGGC